MQCGMHLASKSRLARYKWWCLLQFKPCNLKRCFHCNAEDRGSVATRPRSVVHQVDSRLLRVDMPQETGCLQVFILSSHILLQPRSPDNNQSMTCKGKCKILSNKGIKGRCHRLCKSRSNQAIRRFRATQISCSSQNLWGLRPSPHPYLSILRCSSKHCMHALPTCSSPAHKRATCNSPTPRGPNSSGP